MSCCSCGRQSSRSSLHKTAKFAKEKPGPPRIPILEVENSPPFVKKFPKSFFLQLSTITPITLAETVLLNKRCHFMSIFFVMEDFIFSAIFNRLVELWSKYRL